jgi:transglutaminase-like putative cysteine protease
VSARRELADQLGPTLAAAAAVALTACALAPTLADGPWIASTLTVIAAVALTGGVMRAWAWPGWIVVITQGAILIMVITWMYARDAAWFGVIPGPDTWPVFRALSEAGSFVIEQETAPVPVTPGVQFLVVIGVAAIAWLVDATAVTYRQATIAGVPLLTLYLVPAVVLPNGVPWPLFLLAGAGWLLLLLTDGRRELMRWGRPIDGEASGRLHSVGGTGRRLGAAALTVAVVVPVVLPSLDDGRFGLGAGDGDGAGSGSNDEVDPTRNVVVTVNPIVNLRRDLTLGSDSLMFTYATDAVRPEYFTLATLDRFDGATWTLEELGAGSGQQAADGLPEPNGLGDSLTQTSADYSVDVAGLSSGRLPVPYPAAVVDIEGDWRYDPETLNVFNAQYDGSMPDQNTSLGAEYVVTHRVYSPTVEQLRAAGEPQTPPSTLTEVPAQTESILADVTAEVTEGASTDFDRALQMQNWFRTEFDYSLEAKPGNSDEALESFLRERSGYCEQFAATMALMARLADIPSRVHVGFTPGSPLGDGVWAVTAHDTHAWPELWFEGVGWVRFEPTPGGGDGGATPDYAPAPETDPVDSGNGSSGNGSETVPLRRDDGSGNRGLRDLRREARAAGGDPALPGSSGPTADESGTSNWLLWLTLLGLGGAALLSPVSAARWQRRRRWRTVMTRATSSSAGAVEAAWADILDAATDVDVAADDTETPRDLAQRLPGRCGFSPAGATDLQQLARWVEHQRYAGLDRNLPDAAEIRTRSDRVRTEMFAGLSSRRRRQAKWWPASGRVALLQGWNPIGRTASYASAQLSGRIKTHLMGWFRRHPRDVDPSALRSGS